MGLLDDTAVFAAVLEQGGFSHAAKALGLSNGLVSRRIARLEQTLGVSLIKRTTRQLQLTPEGEVFWQHAQRIQQELDHAISSIQASTDEAQGSLKLSAPPSFGRRDLMPLLCQFMQSFPAIDVDLELTNRQVDLVKEQFDLVIRGSGYQQDSTLLSDSSLRQRLLYKDSIALYASPSYLSQWGEAATPAALQQHAVLHLSQDSAHSARRLREVVWSFSAAGEGEHARVSLALQPRLRYNDLDGGLAACIAGLGIARFTTQSASLAVAQGALKPILKTYDWGSYYLYAVFPSQFALPSRTRLLLAFLSENLSENLTAASTGS